MFCEIHRLRFLYPVLIFGSSGSNGFLVFELIRAFRFCFVGHRNLDFLNFQGRRKFFVFGGSMIVFLALVFYSTIFLCKVRNERKKKRKRKKERTKERKNKEKK